MNRLGKLFSDYVRGKSTKQEKKIIDLWYEEKNKSASDAVTDDDADRFSMQAWEQFLVYREKSEHGRLRKRRFVYGLTAVAAVGLLLLVFNVPFLYLNRSGHSEKQNITVEASISRQFVTDKKMKEITLSDGSVIHMNRDTKVSLRKGKFNAYTREVWLEEGEAFFEVTKDASRPFIVHTADGLTTRVLGTSFNIKTYRQLEKQVVSVKTGLVRVSNEKGENVLLEVNHKATFSAVTGELTTGTTDGTGAAEWRTGRVVLEHVNVEELAFRLNQYYDVEVVNNAIPEELEIYTSFRIDTPLEHVVNNIASIFGISYEIRNNTVYFL